MPKGMPGRPFDGIFVTCHKNGTVMPPQRSNCRNLRGFSAFSGAARLNLHEIAGLLRRVDCAARSSTAHVTI
jgi:hypothetical protein